MSLIGRYVRGFKTQRFTCRCGQTRDVGLVGFTESGYECSCGCTSGTLDIAVPIVPGIAGWREGCSVFHIEEGRVTEKTVEVHGPDLGEWLVLR